MQVLAQMRLISAFSRALQFLGHLILATYGVVIPTFGVGYPLAAALDPQGRAINYFFVSPTFAFPLVVGLLLGYRFGRSLSPAGGWTICFTPLVCLTFWPYASHSAGSSWQSVWTRLFGTACVGDDCYFQFGLQVVATAPLVAALGYPIGAALGSRKRNEVPIAGVPSGASWRRRVCVGSVIAVVVVLSVVQTFAHQGLEIDFAWSEAKGFTAASIKRPPTCRLLSILVAPLDWSVVLQTEPRIASALRKAGWKKASGCVEPVRIWHFPVVLGLDVISNSPCVIVDLTR